MRFGSGSVYDPGLKASWHAKTLLRVTLEHAGIEFQFYSSFALTGAMKPRLAGPSTGFTKVSQVSRFRVGAWGFGVSRRLDYWHLFISLVLSSLELSDTQVYEPCIRALLGTASLTLAERP